MKGVLFISVDCLILDHLGCYGYDRPTSPNMARPHGHGYRRCGHRVHPTAAGFSTTFFAWIHLMDAHTPYGHWKEHLPGLGVDTDIEHTINPGVEGRVTTGEDPEDVVIDTYDACV